MTTEQEYLQLYLQSCFQLGITKTPDIIAKLEADILQEEKDISAELQNLKAKKINCDQLKKLLLSFSPKKKNLIPEEQLHAAEFSTEAQSIFQKILTVIGSDTSNSLRASMLSSCLSLELNDVYYALKHLQAVQVLVRDGDQNILRGSKWEDRFTLFPFLSKND